MAESAVALRPYRHRAPLLSPKTRTTPVVKIPYFRGTSITPDCQHMREIHSDCIPARGLNSAILRRPSAWRGLNKTNGSLSRRNVLQGFRAMANVNGSSRRYKADPKAVIMVDPLEAKRLAAVQMQQLQAEAKFKGQRKIEAINGGWAMLGLTAGLVIEGYTGKGILSQLAGYLNALADFLDQYIPS